MRRLNYTDLLLVVVEYDISELEKHLRSLEKTRNDNMGYEVRPASNKDILGK